MNPIPAEAMPVVEVLRRDVQKPLKLPRFFRGERSLRWQKRRWYEIILREEPTYYCPMGLHPDAHYPRPVDARTFTLTVTDAQVKAFFRWWDNLDEKDAAEAVDAIWPRKAA
jgi:hypothetical protein